MPAHRRSRTPLTGTLLATAAVAGLALAMCSSNPDTTGAENGSDSPNGDSQSEDHETTTPQGNESPGDQPTPRFWIEEHSTDGFHFLVQYIEAPDGIEVAHHDALIEGELTVDEDTGCIGLISHADGDAGEFLLPLFPEGTELVDQNTLYIPSRGGGEFQFGDQVGFGGSESDPERVADIAEGDLTCTADRYWNVRPED